MPPSRALPMLSSVLLLASTWPCRSGQHLCPDSCRAHGETFECSDKAPSLDHIPQCVTNYPHLSSLVLSGNHFQTLRIWTAEDRVNLRTLSLPFNKISLIQDNFFLKLPHLETLNLSHNALAATPSKSFKASGGLPRLHVLDLGFNVISSLDPGAFDGLPSLKTLVLDGNPIKFVDEGALSSLWQLEELSLRSTGFDPAQFHAALDTVARYRLRRIYLGGNEFDCSCYWVKLAAMLNKYKVVVPDMDDIPHCVAEEMHCGAPLHDTLEDLRIASGRYLIERVLHDNTHHHIMALTWLVSVNVLFIASAFVAQCMCGNTRCCREESEASSPHVSSLLCCSDRCRHNGEPSCGNEGCWRGCERCCDITWIDGTEATGLTELRPWGPPWDKQKMLASFQTNPADAAKLAQFASEADGHVGTIRATLQQPTYPPECFDCSDLTAAVKQHASAAHQHGGRLVELADSQHGLPRPCPECQDTAKGMNILFNDSLNLEYVNQGLL